jgi:hypothetical protein
MHSGLCASTDAQEKLGNRVVLGGGVKIGHKGHHAEGQV